jgi:hypothetical protein
MARQYFRETNRFYARWYFLSYTLPVINLIQKFTLNKLYFDFTHALIISNGISDLKKTLGLKTTNI